MSERSYFGLDFESAERFVKILESAKNVSDKIFDLFPVNFFMTDDSGRILKANTVAVDFLDVDEDNILGKKLTSLLEGEAKENFQKYFRDAENKEETATEFEATFNRTDNSEQYIFWQAKKVSSPKKYRLNIHLIISSNITEIRKAHHKVTALEKDLEISRAVQTLLLPSQNEFTSKSFKMASFYRSADRVGGDWWAYDIKKDDSLYAVVGDVTGHGIGPAMVTATTAGAYTAITRSSRDGISMKNLLSELNQSFTALNKSMYCMAVFGASIDPNKDTAELCFCGSLPVFIFRKNGEEVNISKRGTLMGLTDNFTIGTASIPFESGDKMFIYTDGAFEFTDINGRNFNIKKLFRLVKKYIHLEPDVACKHIANDICAAVDNNFKDDVTFVMIERT